MKRKIGVDFTYIIEDTVTGIRKYGEEIIKELARIDKNDEIVLFVDERLQNVFKENFPECKIVPLKYWFKNIKYVRRLNIYRIAKIPKKYVIKKQKCDVIIYPYANRLAPIVNKDKNIVTIHDLIPLDEIENKKSRKYRKIKRESINMMKKTNCIVTISEYSKRKLMEIYPKYKGVIKVIPNSVKKLEKNNIDVTGIIKTKEPYIFTINSFFEHKNQITLVKAFEKIKDQIPHKLILVGRPELKSPKSMYNFVLEYINEHKLNDRVMVLSYISDEERNALFYNTDLFVTNSLMEGFGRTPIEAALCRVPVISTKETALPEVTMNELYYYENATDFNELAEKILYVLNNKPSHEDLEKIARKFEEEYNEERIAKSFITLIEGISKGEENAKN